MQSSNIYALSSSRWEEHGHPPQNIMEQLKMSNGENIDMRALKPSKTNPLNMKNSENILFSATSDCNSRGRYFCHPCNQKSFFCRYLPIRWSSRSLPDGIDSQAGKKCQRCPSDDYHIYCPYTHVALDHLEATQPKPKNKATNNCQQLREIDTNSRPAILLVVATIHFISLNLTVSCHLFRQMYWRDCIWPTSLKFSTTPPAAAETMPQSKTTEVRR